MVVDAVGLGEQQVGVVISVSHHEAFLELDLPVLSEQSDSFRIEADLATASVGLEIGELRYVANDPQLPHQSKAPGFEVTVSPT